MARVPTVGSKQLHIAQLSPEVRRIIAHRTRGAARREYAPVLGADRAAYGAINQKYRSEASSVRGATNAVENSLSNILAGLGSSGLSGGYLKQARAGLTRRQGSAAAAIPFLLADARENRGTELQEARQKQIEDRAAMQKSAATKLNEELESQRDKAQTVLKEQAAANESDSGRSKSEIESLKNASIALKDYLAAWGKNPIDEKTGKHIRELNPLENIDDWRTLAHGLEKEYDGFSLTDAMTVIKHFLQTRSGALRRGKLPQLSIPYGPRQEG